VDAEALLIHVQMYEFFILFQQDAAEE